MAVGARRVAMDFGRFHEDERRGWNKARVLNATDVHLLVACLPAWCSYPWTADARVDLVSLLLALARVRVHAWLRGSARGRVGGGRRVGKQVAPKPQPWAVAVKYCGCFKNRSFHPRSPPSPGPAIFRRNTLPINPLPKNLPEDAARRETGRRKLEKRRQRRLPPPMYLEATIRGQSSSVRFFSLSPFRPAARLSRSFDFLPLL